MAPDSATRFEDARARILESEGDRFAVAERSDLLTGLSPSELEPAVGGGLPEGLSPHLRNLVAAMVEHAAAQKSASPPLWASAVSPVGSPWFATERKSVRAHLLRVSPAAFRGRNLFVDSTAGDRV